jgi:hypothetical protein
MKCKTTILTNIMTFSFLWPHPSGVSPKILFILIWKPKTDTKAHLNAAGVQAAVASPMILQNDF